MDKLPFGGIKVWARSLERTKANVRALLDFLFFAYKF